MRDKLRVIIISAEHGFLLWLKNTNLRDLSKYQLSAHSLNIQQYKLHYTPQRLLTEGDDTRGCGDTIGPPDDEQRAARNMLRSVM